MSVITVKDFYLHESVLHPLCVGIPLTLLTWIYLRFSPNRLLTNLTKFDWIVSVTLGSTLSRVITGSADMLDMTRGAISLLVIIFFQLGMAYITSFYPWTRPYVRAKAQIIVFRGKYMQDRMFRHAILENDVRIGMRRVNVLRLEDIEVMLLEPSGGFTIITTKMMEAAGLGPDDVPESLKGVVEYERLLAEAQAMKDVPV